VDDELEKLKRRKLLELQRRMMRQETEARRPKEQGPREILDRYFVGRAWEVYNAARAQFPTVMPRIEEVLIEAMREGRIREQIDGGSLFSFLRQIGLPVRLRTTIRFEEHGKLKTLEQKIRENR